MASGGKVHIKQRKAVQYLSTKKVAVGVFTGDQGMSTNTIHRTSSEDFFWWVNTEVELLL
jgi:hypothetical protein